MTRLATLAVLLGLLVAPRDAHAQDAEGDDGGTFDASAGASEGTDDAAAASELEAEGYEAPDVLVVADHDTPDALVEEVRALLATTGRVVSDADYVREARSRGLPSGSAEALAAILPDTMPDLDLVIVVGANRPTRASLVALHYYDRFGLQILEEEHAIRGNLLTDESRERVLSEVRLALAVITRPRGGLAQLGGGLAPGEGTPGLAVHVAIEAGAGFGTRELSIPTRNGVLGLDGAVFPSAAVELSVDVEPTARGQLSLGADLAYLTSLGLVTTDMRIDGSTRETGSRSQRLAGGVHVAYRVDASLDSVSLGASLAWSALSFTSVAPVSLPDFTLQGPVLALGIAIPIADRLFTLSLSPEAQWIVDVGGALSALGVSSSGAAVGGSARIRIRIVDPLFADLTYRESHAFVSSDVGGGTDVERFASVRLVYRP